jgi:Ca2+-binding EF-hand superfamily protein
MLSPVAESPLPMRAAVVEEEDDVANRVEEEAFDVGVRQNAIDFSVADADNDNKLDFDEFCKLVAEREEGEHTHEELVARFEYLDGDHSGKVDMHEYLRFALRDALSRSAARVVEIFSEWDEDGSGTISKREFRRAVRSLGFTQNDADIDIVFEEARAPVPRGPLAASCVRSARWTLSLSLSARRPLPRPPSLLLLLCS